MSLETTYQKFRKMEKQISFKRLLLFSLLVGIFSAGLVSLSHPNYLAQNEQPVAKIVMVSMLIMAFMTIPMVWVAGTLAAGIMITLFLIKCRDLYYQTNGKVTGNSLVTNRTFLSNLAKGLDLILFRRLLMRFVLLFDLVFEEIKAGLRYDIEQSKKEILEKVEDGNRIRNENERFYINQNLRLVRELEETKLENVQLKKDLTKSSQAEQVVDDLSSKVIHKQKPFDKSQTRLDEFIYEH